MPAAWLLVEWWRGWFLSGFPWLSLGYSLTDTPLAGFAPIGGVYLLSALVLAMGGALVLLERGSTRQRMLALAVLVLPWPLAFGAARLEWTRAEGPVVRARCCRGRCRRT